MHSDGATATVRNTRCPNVMIGQTRGAEETDNDQPPLARARKMWLKKAPETPVLFYCPRPLFSTLKRQSPHGITLGVAGLAAGRVRGCDCGRRRTGSGACAFCHLSQHASGDLVWREQKRFHLGYGLCILAVQPPCTTALGLALACGSGWLCRILWRSLAGHRRFTGFPTKSTATGVAGSADLHPGQKGIG